MENLEDKNRVEDDLILMDYNQEKRSKRKIYLDTNLQIIFGITLTYIMGVSSITPAFPKIVKELNISAKDVGLLIAVFSFPGILLTPFLGVIADRWGRKRIIIPSLMLFGIAGGLCFFVRDFKLLLILRLFQGVGAAPLGSLTVTIIGDLYSRKELVAAMGYNSSVRSIGSASYPAIGGALAMMGWHYPFILPVIAVPIGFLVLFNLKTPEPENEVHIREHLNIVWKKLRNRQVVGLLVIGIIIFVMLFGSYMTYFPLLLGNSFGLSSLVIGLIMAGVSLIAAFTSSQLGKIIKLFSKKIILKISFILYALALSIIPLISQPWLFFIPIIIFGIAHGMNIPVIQALFAEAAPLKYRATFMSVSGMTFRVGQTLGPLLMGMVISIWGIGGAFYAGAGLSIVMFIIIFRL